MNYGMVIDLTRCVGCNACTVACRAEHGRPAGVNHHKIVKYEFGKYPKARMGFIPMPCMHCRETPCVNVCPTKASERRDDGIVLVDKEKCIGCRACMQACPYQARQFLWDMQSYFANTRTPFEQKKQKGLAPGIVVKCNFCEHRLAEGKQPSCVFTCPAQARYFGDLDDPESEVAKLAAKPNAKQLKQGQGTNPAVYYISEDPLP